MFKPTREDRNTQEHQLAAYCTGLVNDLCEFTSAIMSGNDKGAKQKYSDIMKMENQDIRQLIGDDLAKSVRQIFIKFANDAEPDTAVSAQLDKGSFTPTQFCTTLAEIFSNIALYVGKSQYAEAGELLSVIQGYTNTDYFVSLVKQGNALDIQTNINNLATSLEQRKIDRTKLSRAHDLLVRGSLMDLFPPDLTRSPSP